MSRLFNLGIDVGSTTVKAVVIDGAKNIVYKKYTRHFSEVKKTIEDVLKDVHNKLGSIEIKTVITGSGGIGLARKLGLRFEQEVIASTKAIEEYYPQTDAVIELGGEDAKLTYLTNGIDQRMNGICAGGTGSFIDQMASLLMTDASGLNELAKGYRTIYPIASRCGVFAKTDIQPLVNDGADKSDLAMSIFNAVVVQTISVLSCGRRIEGKVAFLGGPLFFLSELRKRFADVLGLCNEDIIFPEDAQLFVAMGAALLSDEDAGIYQLSSIITRLEEIDSIDDAQDCEIETLFRNDEEYREFKERHDKTRVDLVGFEGYKGNCYLGIDAGSTTTKAVVIGDNGGLLYSYYSGNEGNPLHTTINIIKEVRGLMRERQKIVYATSTGYGEELIKKALRLDFGEIETIAHYKAAKFFNPNVDFILDIGGQDMKCLTVKNGIIDQIILNEACSSGCGSFLETFAHSLSMDIKEFAKEGIKSRNPVELGSRCTVFMNSRVKQAQKEGASVADISAGLAYSVIRNALYKVIKIRDMSQLGDNIVVQGGTFYNDLVLRAFERLIGRNVIRPSIAGIMGAFGAALISRERYSEGYETRIIDLNDLEDLKIESEVTRCRGCSNKCLLTINKFSNDEIFVSGNRCEVGEALYAHKKIDKKNKPINLFKYKYDKLFSYKSLDKDKAWRGEIGIPRVLNMYENYPLWHRFLTELRFRVVLSPRSSTAVFEKGITSIASDTVCYPAKLVHGHIESLIESGINTIFYPSVTYEIREDNLSDNHYNCPVVTSYPEVIKNNMDNIRDKNIKYINIFLSLNNRDKLKKRLYDAFSYYYDDITKNEISRAVDSAFEVYYKHKQDIRDEGERALKLLDETKGKGIILSGRPYHVDPEINHGIPELINSLGFAVISEDSICHLADRENDLRVVDQWVYHSRLYKAAKLVLNRDNLELVQLNSFGCGLDAVTIEQVEEILKQKSKIHTVIKIDEGNNLGAAKIRLRSLSAAIREREANNIVASELKDEKAVYRKNDKINKTHTILAPQMAPMQFEFLESALQLSGLNIKVVRDSSPGVIDEGLRYVNNDACYPAILVVGQLIKGLKSGEYDLDNTSVVITQTGGGCRATNYIGFLRKAMKDAGFGSVPVISLSASGIEDNGLKKYFSIKTGLRLIMALLYGDLIMKLLLRVRPYEKKKDSANELYLKWEERIKHALKRPSYPEFKKNIYDMVKDFDNLPIFDSMVKPRVGLVGEILVKFSPLANNDLIGILEREGAEAVVPELTNFFMACAFNTVYKHENFNKNYKGRLMGMSFVRLIDFYMRTYRDALEKSRRFSSPAKIQELAELTSPVVSVGNQTGEGWLLPGEMIELIESGVNNIICMQPFGCLPNHIIGKGTIKELKRRYEYANIIPIDYDASASTVNQLNRIKLMLSRAMKNMEEQADTAFKEIDINKRRKYVKDKAGVY